MKVIVIVIALILLGYHASKLHSRFQDEIILDVVVLFCDFPIDLVVYVFTPNMLRDTQGLFVLVWSLESIPLSVTCSSRGLGGHRHAGVHQTTCVRILFCEPVRAASSLF